jgi:acyl-CoA synthetase (NDP forming)
VDKEGCTLDRLFRPKSVAVIGASIMEMISSLLAALLLKGVRGEKGINEKGIIEILQRISQLVSEHPMIHELALNPVIALEDQVFVVDARISVATNH